MKSKVEINLEDILYYADDLLMLCTSEEQLKRVIKIITKWSEENGMVLNKKKSGILVFAPRKATKIPLMTYVKEISQNRRNKKCRWIAEQKEIEGIPICEKYKYLGTMLTPKLTCGEQIAQINRKSAFTFTKLYPYLQNATMEARKDMWQTMIRPLFNATMVLLEFEESQNHRKNLQIMWRKTFKQFLLIGKRTSTKLIEEMTGCDLILTAKNIVNESKKQWQQRLNNQEVENKTCINRKPNLLRGVPNTWSLILKNKPPFVQSAENSIDYAQAGI